ncbi:putative aquaporin SIP2-1 [Hibiscus syriacus]|uniref:Aquaporin SIP2-1 n=1 Tax=Hibiscus syriacus TaxID=106335 RepID=A0A6A3BIY0_HIBSY|nr:probable aquaporin SIP2-1 [Hibiscus syriacus]KAE8716986.1 putative aquaporin SIP2-1 [Hibiscus syriacus]
MGKVRLIVYDFVISFMWAWSGVVIKTLVTQVLGIGHQPMADFVKEAFSVVNMFFFAFLGKVTNGGSYNPLFIFASAVSGGFVHFLFSVGARIPAQVIGSIVGVRLIIQMFPEIGSGPRLNVDIHRGALVEGLLAFAIVSISLGLATKIPGSFYTKTWISSISKIVLHILGSDLTGGCMNPASVMGWAYARGDHISKEHILVYWLAPIEATLLAVWTFRLVVKPMTKQNVKAKSE